MNQFCIVALFFPAYAILFSEMKTIPKEFGNFIKLAANNWRVKNKREITVKEIIGFMNRSKNAPTTSKWKAHEMDFFAHFALCPNFVEKIKS